MNVVYLFLSFFLDAKANDAKGDSYFLKFMKSLLALFSSDRGMQEERWAFIIRFGIKPFKISWILIYFKCF
jgi:hypothetical protein